MGHFDKCGTNSGLPVVEIDPTGSTARDRLGA